MVEATNKRIDVLELRIKESFDNIKEILRIHNETHAKQHELYSDNQRIADTVIANRLDGSDYKIKQLTENITYIQQCLSKLAAHEDVQSVEERVRKLEVDIYSMQTDKKSDDENRATWLLVGLTLFAAILGLLSNLIGYFVS